MADRIVFLGADAAYMLAFRGELLRAFVARGDTVVAIATPLDDFDPAPFGALGVEFIPWAVRKAAVDPLAEIGTWRELGGLLRDVRADVLVAHTIKPVILGMLAGAQAAVPRRVALIPGLGHAFMPTRSLAHVFVHWAARLGYWSALRAAHLVIFQNTDDINDFRRLGLLAADQPVGLVNGSGVDMDAFAPAPPPPGPPVFLMVARLLRDKGVHEFVEAARLVKTQLPQARFVLVGAADANPTAVSQNEVDRWVAEGLIEARGFVGDPRAEYAGCHVFVLPSYYREGTPRTNLEAMSSGRAVITTDAPGCRETVVHGETGFLVPPRDVAALAEAMARLGRDLALARAMGEAGRRYCAERYELGQVVAAMTALIDGRAGGAASAASG